MPPYYETMRRFLQHIKGATAIEYSLIAAGIGLAIFVTVFTFGDDLLVVYDDLGAALLRNSL